MMNINETPASPTSLGFPPGSAQTVSFRPSLFTHAKKAKAHKSSLAEVGEKGCGCEGGSVHGSDLTEMI